MGFRSTIRAKRSGVLQDSVKPRGGGGGADRVVITLATTGQRSSGARPITCGEMTGVCVCAGGSQSRGLAALRFRVASLIGSRFPRCPGKVGSKSRPPACCHSGTRGRGLAACPIMGVAAPVRVVLLPWDAVGGVGCGLQGCRSWFFLAQIVSQCPEKLQVATPRPVSQ